MHILIIEDEKQLCQSIAEGLRMDGYEADTCFDGDEGLELCLVENYDLILLDLNLPGVMVWKSCASFGNPILPLPF